MGSGGYIKTNTFNIRKYERFYDNNIIQDDIINEDNSELANINEYEYELYKEINEFSEWILNIIYSYFYFIIQLFNLKYK